MGHYTVLTSLGALSDVTSTISVPGRGYIHMQFRAGSVASNASVVNSTMSMTVALQRQMIGAGTETNMWADVQTWAIATTESLPGRDLAYLNAEQEGYYRLLVKSYTSGYCQARIWGE